MKPTVCRSQLDPRRTTGTQDHRGHLARKGFLDAMKWKSVGRPKGRTVEVRAHLLAGTAKARAGLRVNSKDMSTTGTTAM